jgi:undecaprenyl-diphosphatase
MISILQAIILGAVQGATEFLPVSSSGHLVLVAKILDIPTNLAAETLLNFGTIFVIAIYFWPQIWKVCKDILGISSKLKFAEKKEMLIKLMIGILPAVIIGFLFENIIEEYLHSTGTVVFMLATIGVAMIFVKPKKSFGLGSKLKGAKSQNILNSVSYKQAAVVGLAQPLALISGSSRSGVTILAGIWSGLSVEVAASFSFLIGLPIILAATLKFLVSSEGLDFLKNNMSSFIAGNVASFIIGAVAVKVLMDVVKKKGLVPFGIYRVILAVAVLLFVII